ncbi:MAG TPA: hypothetical protein VFM35_00455, partial [Candidatus Binatia bacterium]|nr:hypothetical protein [Candidatus Binatia bacterium]
NPLALPSPRDRRLYRNREDMAVILNGVKNLDRDPSASPQDDIATESPIAVGEEPRERAFNGRGDSR